MQVFGLDPIVAAVLITTVGVTLQNVLGWLKNQDGFDPRLVASSALIAFVISLQMVIPVIENIPEDIEQIAKFQILIVAIASIAGIDALGKNGIKAVLKGRNKKEPQDGFFDNNEGDFDDSDRPTEVPPGKG
ncbi:hypothetical protein LCGC14_0372640 [marine sediment metagenome]|uniref:Uncharacterized protein n=1 Tax=marine sediment metagenome TaxID=412755 RepID=A0A0F9WDD0_9ZZZZ